MRTRLLAMLVGLGLVVVTPGLAVADHAWSDYHWARQQNPFTLKLGDNMSSKWDPHLATSSSDWSASSVLDTTVVRGSTRPKPCKATAGMVEVCNAGYGFNGWLGVATVWLSGSHITQGTVKVNDSYFSTKTYDTPEWRNSVLCQEVGHTLGLDHQDETFDNQNLGSCMDYTNSPADNQHPNDHDYAQLETIYAHLDSTTTVGDNASAPPKRVRVGNDESTWGQRVQGSRAAGHATYVRHFGGGHSVVTFVVWS